MAVFVPVPEGLDLTEAAALPMAVETATRSIDLLGLTAGQTILVNGGGTMTDVMAELRDWALPGASKSDYDTQQKLVMPRESGASSNHQT